jgi:hypothetical protein
MLKVRDLIRVGQAAGLFHGPLSAIGSSTVPLPTLFSLMLLNLLNANPLTFNRLIQKKAA